MFDPVEQIRQIYREYQLTLLNRKYYDYRLSKFKQYNTIVESVIAAGATGSGLAGLTVLKFGVGSYVWAAISTASALLAFAKPFLKFGDRIEGYSKLFGEYAKAHLGLDFLVKDFQVNKVITDEDIKLFKQIRSRISEFISSEDSRRNSNLMKKFQEEVDKKATIDGLWVPEINVPAAFRAICTDDRFTGIAKAMQPYLTSRSPKIQRLVKEIDPNDLRLSGDTLKARQVMNAWISNDDVTAANQQQWLNAITAEA